MVVRWQKPIFGLKCAISSNNHFFAFFDSSWWIDEILSGWELDVGLAFSESKMVAKMGDTYNIHRSEHTICSKHSRMVVLESKSTGFVRVLKIHETLRFFSCKNYVLICP